MYTGIALLGNGLSVISISITLVRVLIVLRTNTFLENQEIAVRPSR